MVARWGPEEGHQGGTGLGFRLVAGKGPGAGCAGRQQQVQGKGAKQGRVRA